MKKADLLKQLKGIAKGKGTTFEFVRPGSKHDVYRIGGQIIPIPRHREINEITAQGILKTADQIQSEGDEE